MSSYVGLIYTDCRPTTAIFVQSPINELKDASALIQAFKATHIKVKDEANANLCASYLAVIEKTKKRKDKTSNYWRDKYQKYLKIGAEQTEDENVTSVDKKILQFKKEVTSGQLVAIVNGFCDKGNFGRAANELAEHIEQDPEALKPKLGNMEENIDFIYQGELIRHFTGPAQEIVTRFVQGRQPGYKKDGMQFALGLINANQILMPNLIPNLVQRGLAYADYGLVNAATAERNWSEQKEKLWKELFPTTFKTVTGSAALKWSQLAFAGLRALPLERLAKRGYVSPHLVRRQQKVLNYGGYAFQAISTWQSISQLSSHGLSHQHSLEWVSSLACMGMSRAGQFYINYKNGRGQGIINPDSYRLWNTTQNTMGFFACLYTLQSALKEGNTLLKSKEAIWGVAAGAIILGVGKLVYDWFSTVTKQETHQQALAAALANVQYYQQLAFIIQYVEQVPFTFIDGAPKREQLKLVETGKLIIFAKQRHEIYLYCINETGKTYRKEKIKSRQMKRWLEDMPWTCLDVIEQSEDMPWTYSDVIEQKEMDKASSPSLTAKVQQDLVTTQLAKIRAKTLLILLKTPLIDAYTATAIYKINFGGLAAEEFEPIKQGKEIVFDINSETKVYTELYVRGQNGSCDKISDAIPAWLQMIVDRHVLVNAGVTDKSCKTRIIEPNTDEYVLAQAYTTSQLIAQRIRDNHKVMKQLLTEGFSGLIYQEAQSDFINQVRVQHLMRKVQTYLQQEDYQAILEATKAIEHTDTNNVVISKKYKLPPHLAWQVLQYRLFAFIYSDSSEHNLLHFKDEFNSCIDMINNSMQSDYMWQEEVWPQACKQLEKAVAQALKQCILRADNKELSLNSRKKYLEQVTEVYESVSAWDKLLNDEYKFYLAVVANDLAVTKQERQNCRVFFESISDLAALIREKQQGPFTQQVMQLLAVLDVKQHEKLLAEKDRQKYALTELVLKQHAQDLVQRGQYQLAYKVLNECRAFLGKGYLNAVASFCAASKADVLTPLSHLMAVPRDERDHNYWLLLWELLNQSLCSSQYSNSNQRADAVVQLKGLIYICLQYLQHPKHYNSLTIDKKCLVAKSHNRIKADFQDYPYTKNLLAFGHKCFRGETDVDLGRYIHQLLNKISLKLIEGGIQQAYLPVEVSNDGDCAFHALDIDRESAIQCLLDHVITKRWLGKKLLGDTQRIDIIEILLKDLEHKNNEKYDRSADNFQKNVNRVTNYLEQLRKPGTWVAYNQKSHGVLEALALLRKQNLEIYVANDNGELVLSNQPNYRQGFETVRIMCVAAGQFSLDQSKFNHYVKLTELTNCVQELVTENEEEEEKEEVIKIDTTSGSNGKSVVVNMSQQGLWCRDKDQRRDEKVFGPNKLNRRQFG